MRTRHEYIATIKSLESRKNAIYTLKSGLIDSIDKMGRARDTID